MANNYSVAAKSGTFGGIPLNTGRGDSEWCKIEKIEKGTFKLKQGVDGTVTYFTSKKNGHKVTIVTMQGAALNDVLSAIFNGDILLDNGSGIGPLEISDGLGTSIFLEAEARIEDLPDETMAEEPGTLEWVFLCPDPIRNVGSN